MQIIFSCLKIFLLRGRWRRYHEYVSFDKQNHRNVFYNYSRCNVELVNGAFCNQSSNLLGWGRWGVYADGLVGQHVLLLPETLATEVAVVEAGHVTPLVDHQVVRLREGTIAPTTVIRLSDRANLEKLLEN